MGETGEHAHRRRILFVDDQGPFLEMIQRLATQWGGSVWEVFVAASAGEAMDLIQARAIDLVVLDLDMPVIDGWQFLSLLARRFPQTQRVVLTGFASETHRAACLNAGAELFLEKPRTAEGMNSVFAALKALISLPAEEGFRGVLRRVGLIDVVQMECLSRHSALLEIVAGAYRGLVYIKDGSIIHAEAPGQTGEAAFNELMVLRGGEFSLKPFTEPPSQTISGSWEFLLMEACRKRDEGLVPPPEALEPAVTPALPLAATIPPASPVPPPPTAGHTTAPLPPAASLPPRVQVDEVLLCSQQGDVLHEYRCVEPNQRISLIEFVSQKTRLFGAGLPLGSFDRLEFVGGSGRLVVRVRDGHGLLVRTSPQARAHLNLAQE